MWLAPTTHELRNVCVPWPLHLLGGGARPEETVLSCPRGADTALDFRANGKVANLCVRATLAPCITHRAGQLSVERCLLSCESGGLDHLCAPLLTLACLCAPPAAGTAAAVAALPRAAGGGTGGGSPVGEGRLTVTECRLLGGLHAVQCRGTGSLQRVRAIYHASSKLFWFEIDCRAPGQLQGAPTSHYGPHQGALGGGCQAADCGSGGAPPPPCQPGKPQPAAGEIAMPGDCNRCVSDAAAVAGVARITEAFAKVSPEVIQALMVAARAPAAVIMPAADATGVSLLGPHPYGAAAVSASASQSSGAEARAPDHAAGSKRRREDSTMLE